MKFHIQCFPCLIDKGIGVNTRAFHVPVILWNSQIIIKEGERVQAFWKVGEEVKDPPSLLDVRLGVRFESTDRVREFHCITDKKDGEIVSNQVKITLRLRRTKSPHE